jgi:hypothetical protein
MKLFKKKEKNPKSEEFVETIKSVLECHGITDKRRQNECAHAMFKSSIRMMNAISAKKNIDAALATETERMREELAKGGITDPEAQEKIVLMYFGILADLAGIKE